MSKADKLLIAGLEKRIRSLERKQAHWDIAIQDYNLRMMDEKILKMFKIKKMAKRRDIDGSPEKNGGTGTSRRSVKNPAKVFKN